MTELFIFTVIIIGLNCIPLLIRRELPVVGKIIIKTLTATAILFLIFATFEFNGYKLKGFYTFSIIIWLFIIATISFFAFVKNTKKKVLSVLLLIPLVVLSIVMLIIGRRVYQHKIDDTNTITVTTGGFLACGEIMCITQTRFVIFDKQVLNIDDLCLIGISQIEIIKSGDKHIELLIYHNGRHDTENPYRYGLKKSL